MEDFKNNEEIKIFQEYLRIPSVHPNIDYEPCVNFLKQQADDLGLEINVVHPVSNDKPVVVITYQGMRQDLQSIMLNSHMDVVPVFEEFWTHKPFAAEIDEDGNIFARGTQDTKAIGMQYLAALRYFVKNGIKFNRTIYVTFVCEEEVGGDGGMKDFVHTDFFNKMNVGFALDESAPFEKDPRIFFAWHAERVKWAVKIKVNGETGHGSIMLEETAAEKLLRIFNKFYEYRNSQIEILKANPLNFSETVGINATIINGGVQINVVPAEFSISFDIRIGPNVNHDEFENMIRDWCKDDGFSIEFEQKDPYVEPTKIDDSNKYWIAMNKAMEEMNYKFLPLTMPATTDARFLRQLGIPAIGFAPMSNIPIKAHAHDEFLPASMYLQGIEIYKKLIEFIANC